MPDTNAYLYLGLAIVGIVLTTYTVSLVLRLRKTNPGQNR